MTYPPLRNPHYVVISISIDLLSNSKRNTPFHRIAHNYFHVDWDSLGAHLRDIT